MLYKLAFLAMVASCSTGLAGEPRFTVVNKTGKRFVVVNRMPACPCTDCKCESGVCPACPAQAVSSTSCPGGVCDVPLAGSTSCSGGQCQPVSQSNGWYPGKLLGRRR